MYKGDNYKKKNNDPHKIHIKWVAIESTRDQIFSTQSDVWSFGIMLWEFFTLAETPYPGMEVKEQYQKLIEGYRMEQPDYAVHEIYDIMSQCWITEPTFKLYKSHRNGWKFIGRKCGESFGKKNDTNKFDTKWNSRTIYQIRLYPKSL